MEQEGRTAGGRGEYFALAVIYVLSVANVFKIKEAALSDGGYRIVSRLAGESEAMISWLSRLHFYAADILLLLGVIPLLLAGLARLVGPRSFARLVLLLSLALVGLSFLNLNALGITGKFFSADQVAPMLTWARERPGTVFDYVSPSALGKLALVLALIGGVYRCRRAALFSAFTPAPLLLFVAACAANLLSVFAWEADALPHTPFHEAAAIRMSEALLAEDAQAVAPDELDAAAAGLAYHCAPPAAGAQAGGAAHKRNFLLFVMETVPHELFAGSRAEDRPTFDALERSGYRAANHYSTYPFTSYARFSIFTGLYPSYRLEKTLPLGSGHPAGRSYRSFFSALADDGYDFKVFDPVTKRYEVDDWLVRQLHGEVVGADADGSVADKDARVLDLLVRQIGAASQRGQPFAYAILPQLTHGPWLPPEASKAALFEEGRARLRRLDASLAAIVDALKRAGVYQDTVIVVTADHGLRTRKEAGFLKTSVLNETSYHVPMLIHDPRLKRRVEIAGLTSHLDISPTLHCLYGKRTAPIDTQGRAMSPASTLPRTVYFGGAWYNGSDGLWDGHAFYSYNHQLHMLWKGGQFEFDESFPVRDARVVGRMAGLMRRHGSMQEALLAR